MLTILLLKDKQVDKRIQKEAQKIKSETLEPVKNSYRRFRKVQILSGQKISLKSFYCKPNKNDKKMLPPKLNRIKTDLGCIPNLPHWGSMKDIHLTFKAK